MQSWRRSVAAQTILGFDDGTEKVTYPKSQAELGLPSKPPGLSPHPCTELSPPMFLKESAYLLTCNVVPRRIAMGTFLLVWVQCLQNYGPGPLWECEAASAVPRQGLITADWPMRKGAPLDPLSLPRSGSLWPSHVLNASVTQADPPF